MQGLLFSTAPRELIYLGSRHIALLPKAESVNAQLLLHTFIKGLEGLGLDTYTYNNKQGASKRTTINVNMHVDATKYCCSIYCSSIVVS